MNLGELFVQIGAIGNSKEVKAFGEAVKKAGKAIDDYDKKLKKGQETGDKATVSIKGTVTAILGIAGAVAGAYYALDRLTNSLAKQNLQWLNLTRQSDIALSTFQKWGTIGKIVGVDNAAQQLENLNQKIFNLRLTGEGAKGFQMAGIMPTNAEDVLEQLRGRIAGMSNTSATYLLQQMGLDPKMITLLRMGREEWEQYLEVQRRYTLNESQRREIDRLNRQLEVARIKMEYLKERIVLALMPAFTRLTRFLTSATEGIARFVNWIAKGQSPAAKLTRGILGIASALGVVKVALMAITAHPIIAAITGIISAIMLLADDVNHYLTGGDSLIGTIINGLEDLKLKGFLDFPVPKWLEYIIKFIDFVTGAATDRAVKARLEETVKNIDPEAVMLKDGGYADIPSEFLTQEARRNINNNKTTNNNKNTTISMNNTFYSNQPAQDTANELRFYQAQFA